MRGLGFGTVTGVDRRSMTKCQYSHRRYQNHWLHNYDLCFFKCRGSSQRGKNVSSKTQRRNIGLRRTPVFPPCLELIVRDGLTSTSREVRGGGAPPVSVVLTLLVPDGGRSERIGLSITLVGPLWTPSLHPPPVRTHSSVLTLSDSRSHRSSPPRD